MLSSHVPEPSADQPDGIPIESVWPNYARFVGIAEQRLAERAALVAPEPPPAAMASNQKTA